VSLYDISNLGVLAVDSLSHVQSPLIESNPFSTCCIKI